MRRALKIFLSLMQYIWTTTTPQKGIGMNRLARKLRLKMNTAGNDEFGK